MRTHLQATRPEEIEFSLTVTMSLKDWRTVQGQLSKAWPSWELSSAITQMVTEAERRFYPRAETTETMRSGE